MPISIPVKRIQFPAHYIREKINKEIVKEWAADLKERKTWYFPPLEVWIPPKGLKQGKSHELIDGNKRLSAAALAGIKTVPCILRAFRKPVDAYVRQWHSNSTNGEFLTKAQRNHYIQTMRNIFQLDLPTIAKITHLNKSQVSRIARKIPSPSKRSAPAASQQGGNVFSVKGYFTDLAGICAIPDKYKQSLEKFCNAKYGKPLTTRILEALGSLHDALTEAMKAAEEATAGQEG